MSNTPLIAVLIPALNEAQNIGKVIDGIPEWINRIVVCDNNSTDDTARIAREHGAETVLETRRGYGAACAGAVAHVKNGSGQKPEILVFMDGDFSDDPGEIEALIEPIIAQNMELVIGSRTQGSCEKGALSLTQRFGNWLSCRLTSLFFEFEYTDLGPFRAITSDALDRLTLDNLGYGWTIQMQVRAARQKLRIAEIPVCYRNRAAGKSKVSGSIRGIVGAGTTILYIIFAEAADAGLSSVTNGTAFAHLSSRLRKCIQRTLLTGGFDGQSQTGVQNNH